MSALTISKNLIKYRKHVGLSQEKLAEIAGISVGYVSKLERSIPTNTSVSVLLRIAEALDITLNDLVYDNTENQLTQLPNQKQLNKMLGELDNKTSEQLCQNIIDSIKLLKH
ncbi:helix-turn-helix domain-containing protein [Limosilactobacillus reuteri]|uniref:helix-turn-helix domain-containing protein n=1 Tax=Limosilactobacillus reuteri TaxID=1598 RepID=UPI001E485091|nr:helix-turn-helix transcriptional regulator [Limosilactobacillus reuteri]MCC4326065.1 helix-turn-helix domain-containing protein [Limosilactobacillus reuteri]MCC4329815.1 helix-turn-helix domain-containing protein [Limosilactobacillus reuteri]